jgi:hypothetical protein
LHRKSFTYGSAATLAVSLRLSVRQLKYQAVPKLTALKQSLDQVYEPSVSRRLTARVRPSRTQRLIRSKPRVFELRAGRLGFSQYASPKCGRDARAPLAFLKSGIGLSKQQPTLFELLSPIGSSSIQKQKYYRKPYQLTRNDNLSLAFTNKEWYYHSRQLRSFG